ncbi:MAG TPA: carboxypeptidase-like regulatory domain-containing protein [Chitinophagaceae bacterium]|nr:carboxypeptidase-like regulatory domain-containing protein [Chitinophagaceae bacterium]
MSKKIQLSIPTPCHENWDAMTPVEKGKFCGSCQKQVVDFSTMSDRQVAEFFKKPSTGSVCGRFMTEQLDREIEIPKKRIPWLKYFFGILLPAFFMSKASAQKLMGKVAAMPNRDTLRVSANEELRTLGMVLPTEIKPVVGDTICTNTSNVKGEIITNVIPEQRIITGTVTDEEGNLLPGASVVIKGRRTGVAVDRNGTFRIKASTGNVLLVSGYGLEPTESTVGKESNVQIIVRKLISCGREVIVTAGMVVVKKKTNRKEIPLIKQLLRDTASKLFKVFPNPVPSGSNLTIEWKETEEGYYSFQLLNQSGQIAHQREIWIDDKARLLNLDIPSVAAGNYFIVFTSKKTGKRFSEKIIIQ